MFPDWFLAIPIDQSRVPHHISNMQYYNLDLIYFTMILRTLLFPVWHQVLSWNMFLMFTYDVY